MKSIKPVGSMVLLLPLPKENETTDAGVIIVDQTFTKGKVMEVSDEYYETYKKGDIVIYPEGAGISQRYKMQNCLWINGQGYPKGEIVGIIIDEKV